MAKGHKGPGMGRPKKDIDWVLLDSNVSLDASLMFCGEAQLRKWQQIENQNIKLGLPVSKKPIEITNKSIDAACEIVEMRIREQFNSTFSEYRDKRKEPYRMSLRQKQKNVALVDGNVTMLIWLGKQELGQKDKIENDVKSTDGSMSPVLIDQTQVKELLKKIENDV